MTIKNKIGALLVLFSMGLSGSVLAENHFYVGADAGYANFQNIKKVSSQFVFPNVGPFQPVVNNLKSSANGELYGVFAGIDHRFKNGFDLGLELNADWMNNRIKQDNSSTPLNKSSITEQIDYLAGISVLPGYYVSPKTKIYLRASVGSAHFTSHLSGAVNAGTPKGYQGNLTHSGLYYGLGLGVSTALTKHVSLGLEADHLWVQGFSNVSKINGSGSYHLVSAHYHPQINEAKMTLSYRF